MAVTFDSKFEKGASNQASPFSFVSNAGTVAGTIGSNSSRVLIVVLGFRVTGLTSVAASWDGVSMTAIGDVTAPSSTGRTYMFGLINPSTGNKTLLASWAGAASDVSLGGISVYNADQSTGWSNFNSATATSATMSVSITTASGDMAVGGAFDNNSSSATITAGTSDWNERALDGNYQGAHNAASGSSAALSWTLGSSKAWGAAGVRVLQAVTGKLFRSPSLSGVGVGGPFFRDPLQSKADIIARKREQYIQRAAASCYKKAA